MSLVASLWSIADSFQWYMQQNYYRSTALAIHPSILYTCRLINNEAEYFLYDSNIFVLPTWLSYPWQQSSRMDCSNKKPAGPLCNEHAHLPRIIRIRKICVPLAPSNPFLVKGIRNYLRPEVSDQELRWPDELRWQGFPLAQVNEILVGIFATSANSTKPYLHRVKNIIGSQTMVGLLAEWYARGGLKLTFFSHSITETLVEAFELVVKDIRGRRIEGIDGMEGPPWDLVVPEEVELIVTNCTYRRLSELKAHDLLT
ncbi:hypothetical protein MMC13_005561 [Lambiella insularis]|nr:hypothetical protein [Lambiella insularis]